MLNPRDGNLSQPSLLWKKQFRPNNEHIRGIIDSLNSKIVKSAWTGATSLL